ncbi:MAG: PAS domain S-box protein [Chloroflexota bacterium]
MFHPLLENNLNEVGFEADALPTDLNSWKAFLESLSLTFTQTEQDRSLLEGSLSRASEEMRQEITDRKKVEEAFAEERNLLRTLIDASPDYIYIKDRASRFVIGNIATAQSLGAATPDDIVGKTDFDFHAPQLAAIFYAEEQALMQSGTPALNREEAVVDQRTGQLQQLLSTNVPLYDNQGQITGLVGFNRDITERKRAEEALQESEERYRTVTELISDYAFSKRVEPDGTLVDEWVTGDSFTRLTGYPAEEIGSRHTPYHPDEVEAVQQQLQAVLQGQTSSQECRIITKDGAIRWLLLHRHPVWDAQQNRVIRYYGVAQDITARKNAEVAQRESERLHIALDKEKELGELKTKLMITISHEFRTPLSVAYTSAELLEKYYGRMSVEQRATHLHKVKTQIQKLVGMLEDISLLIHAKFGELTLNLEPTDLQKLCKAALLTLEDFDDAQQRIEVNIDKKLPNFMLDARRLQYVLTNLLSNALKYSDQATKIALDVFEQNDGITIQVVDQGIGIPNDEQVHLFEPFYRANNVGAIGGTGLGLSIVKEIVEMHNGTISLRSEAHQGTQVVIFLPRQALKMMHL